MNISLSVLLLVFGALTFWILNESSLRWYMKTLCISAFCLFTVVFWSSIHTYLGWPALEKEMPNKSLIHWVIIKEPNKIIKSEGDIYIMLESVDVKGGNSLTKFFGYKKDKVEPRVYGLPYSRKLHEQLEKEVMGKLKKGQPVFGRLTKGKEGPSSKGEKGKSDKKGEGSESQEQGWEFHELSPSEIHQKPTQ
jgi:hypothetical protein|tara:strand:- start:1331 stop:1909 length:579 start_codon:yes stop_codon:yes gene_type:complete